jgi:hypothetical protein
MTEAETEIDPAIGNIEITESLGILIMVMKIIWVLTKFLCRQSLAKAEEGSVRDPL